MRSVTSILCLWFLVGCVDGSPSGSHAREAGAEGAEKEPRAEPSDAGSTDFETSLDVACWHGDGSTCNPLDNAGCSDGMVCGFPRDDARLVLVCREQRARAEVGATCSDVAGVDCVAGALCVSGSCRQACCSDDDCSTRGHQCIAFEPKLGTLGVCGAPEACRDAGDSCKSNRDCCSGECHVGHCH
ncbi:MAG: hypothetical protein BGO98_26175 [Myxococcales bacterium 68-20]|nr:MAG: hypothetical protein BGO98_26175 [Myxococcales bacterium 68-20]